MIIGTAGHIDHGKTTLVRALSGVDTDRLKEEKARGISIELGYAYTPLDTGGALGFIDVPGHERLVHTMLAGACGIDFALLVVAADDGVMPQTREHAAILTLLGVDRGAVAITKRDRVAPEQLAMVESEIAGLLASTPLAPAPRFHVDGTDAADPGVVALGNALRTAATQIPRRTSRGLFRLAIDRSFTMVGQGTIVTGTVFGGRAEVGATLTVMPSGIEVRVRAIHAQNRPASAGAAGERCAFNLAGVETAAISRGDWLAEPDAVIATERIDARMTLVPQESVPGAYTPVHLHFGAAHVPAHMLQIDETPLAPGGSGRVQFVLPRTVAAAPRDRFIVRNAQANRTLGGGIFLDPAAPARRRRHSVRRDFLDALERAIASGDVAPVVEAAPWGVSRAELLRIAAASREQLAPTLAVRRIDIGHGTREECWIAERRWHAHAEELLAALAGFHAAHAAEPGPDSARLRRIAAPTAPERVWRALVDELVASGRVCRAGAWLQLPAHAAVLSERDRATATQLRGLLAAGRFNPPWARDLASQTGEPAERVRRLLADLGRGGDAYPVVPDLYFERTAIAELAEIFSRLVDEHGGVEAAAFRDATGLGRKRAIQILEFFDRVGHSRRVGDRHVPRAGGGWPAGR